MEMGVSRGVYEQRNRRERVGDRERERESHVSVLSCPVLSPHQRRKLLSLKSWLLLDAISAHLKFFS